MQLTVTFKFVNSALGTVTWEFILISLTWNQALNSFRSIQSKKVANGSKILEFASTATDLMSSIAAIVFDFLLHFDSVQPALLNNRKGNPQKCSQSFSSISTPPFFGYELLLSSKVFGWILECRNAHLGSTECPHAKATDRTPAIRTGHSGVKHNTHFNFPGK